MSGNDDQRSPQRALAAAAVVAGESLVPHRPRTPTRWCSICRLPIMGTEDNVCWYHERDTTVTWADINKRFCDWLHRGAGRR
jgi:hypothetical protein